MSRASGDSHAKELPRAAIEPVMTATIGRVATWGLLFGLAACAADGAVGRDDGRGNGETADAARGGASGGGNGASGGGGIGGAGATIANGACTTGILCGEEGACCAEGAECVRGECLQACESGVRCADACCLDGDLCLAGTCTTPGDKCLDSVDCAAGEFCEPSVLRCAPELPAGDITCEVTRPPATFKPVLKWKWPNPTPKVHPTYVQAVSAPLVFPLASRETVGVVATSCADVGQTPNPGYLRMLDGVTGEELWEASVDALQPENQVECPHSPAAADIDADGKVEIVAMGSDWRLLAFDEDGKLEWRSTRPGGAPYAFPTDYYPSAVVIADMDADGKGEVVVGGVVFDAGGVLVAGDGRHELAAPGSGWGASSILADVDGDGAQEVVSGNVAYRVDGTELWSQPSLADGLPAIADFEQDGVPELVVSHKGGVRVQNAATGTLLKELPLALFYPGVPVIGDFDGDGTPEIGAQDTMRSASTEACAFRVYEYDAGAGVSEKWATPLPECSGFLSATAFDFEGDGAVEVLTHDDCFVYVLDGTTGAEHMRLSAPHATWTEFVSLADVDGDLSADIFFSAHDVWNGAPPLNGAQCGYGAGDDGLRHGVFTYSDPDRAWMPTRRIWNQQAYHITNVRADGSLPKPESDSWGAMGYNNYRVAAQGKAVGYGADLVVSLSASLVGFCPGEVQLVALVENQGIVGVPVGVKLTFHDGQGKEIGTAKTTKKLPPGGSEAVSVTAPIDGKQNYSVEVDTDTGAGAVIECVEDNNTSAVHEVTCTRLVE